ncbi:MULTISPECIES: MerC domain-containing protein [unclassified Sphingosinithalassobacter]|uniref:MerC domain-containing protein n=1 Tax=unclassified Sphingosinithalassobacter TaxID=2676235 RepID=UPI00165E4554|nr:MerC domain-containing protein [Sphingosinithalassobacter sp. CS137]
MPAVLSLSRMWGGVDSRLDRWAIGISGLCLAHCLATTVFLALLSSAGALFNPLIHEVGLVLAIAFGVLALGRGIVTHGYFTPAVVGAFGLGMMAGALSLPHGGHETFWTIAGVALVALGHDLNRRAAR